MIKRLSRFKVFPLRQWSNPIDKTPIGGQGASTAYNLLVNHWGSIDISDVPDLERWEVMG